MKRIKRLIILSAVVAAASCLLSASFSHASKIIEQPIIGFFASIPKVESQDKALPALVCLPGSGVKAKDDLYHWAFAANKRGFVVIALEVNYLNDSAQVVYSKLQTVMDSIADKCSVDRGRVFIAGTSAGGMMAISLALFYPHQFKAAGVLSGARMGFGAPEALKNARGQLFYFYHGGKDKTISRAEYLKTVRKLERSGAVVELKTIPDSGHTLPPNYYRELVDKFYQLSELCQ